MGEKILSISPFSPPSFLLKWDFGGDGVPVRLRSRPKASISLSPESVTALLITQQRKEKWMTGPLSTPPAPPFLLSTPWLWAKPTPPPTSFSQLEEAEQKMLNDGQVCRHCAVLLCTEGDHWFALRLGTENTNAPIHISLFHPYNRTTSHMAALSESKNQCLSHFLSSMMVGCYLPACGSSSPDLTREGKLSAPLCQWFQIHTLAQRECTSSPWVASALTNHIGCLQWWRDDTSPPSFI